METNKHSVPQRNGVVARQMLEALAQRLGRPLTTADVLMEFADRAHRGEPVDRDDLLAHADEFLKHLSPDKLAKLDTNLRRSEWLTTLGQTYREGKVTSGAPR